MGLGNRAEPGRFYVAESKLAVFDGEKCRPDKERRVAKRLLNVLGCIIGCFGRFTRHSENGPSTARSGLTTDNARYQGQQTT